MTKPWEVFNDRDNETESAVAQVRSFVGQSSGEGDLLTVRRPTGLATGERELRVNLLRGTWIFGRNHVQL